MVDLATRVGLSSTAIARRQRSLEESGFIQGYQAVLDLGRFGLRTTVLVRIALESQSEQALPDGREAQRADVLFHQRRPVVAFERLQLVRQRGLGEEQPGRRFGQAAALG